MLSEKDKIKHLYHRAGFGLAVKELKENKGYTAILESILKKPSGYKALETISLAQVQEMQEQIKAANDKGEKKDVKQVLKQNIFGLNGMWFNEMVQTNSPLREKMALFWHGHFACRSINPYFEQQYLDIIRKHALGNFGAMLTEISRTPAMLQFLNNQQNKKDHPNENFAREVMELFTLGRGNYTEQDIKEAARAFTGFGFDKMGDFKFRVQQHDFGTKTFQGKTGNFSGEDILKIILEKKECAYFITKKIYKYFVNEETDEATITTLAGQFYQSGYDIKKLMENIFRSDWFYSEKNVGVRIKSPIELMAGMFRTIPVEFSQEQSLLFIQRTLGQVLFNPPNVAGWSGGRNWIDSSTLLFRMRLPQAIYYDKELNTAPKEDIPEMGAIKMKMTSDYVKMMASKKLNATSNWSDVMDYFTNNKNTVTDITQTILAKQPDATALKCISNNIDNSTKENEIKSTIIETMSLPEYQLC